MDFFNYFGIVHCVKCFHVSSLQFQQRHVLLVVDLQLQVLYYRFNDKLIGTLVLDLVLQENIIGGGLFKGDPEVSGDDDVDDVDLLNVDPEFVESQVEFPHHLRGEF
jgi:hypothetical protein